MLLDQRGLRGEPLERAVEQAAALVVREIDSGAEVSLALAGQSLAAGAGDGQRHAALRILALVEACGGDEAPPEPDAGASVLEVRG